MNSLLLASNLAKDFQSLANNIIFMPFLPPPSGDSQVPSRCQSPLSSAAVSSIFVYSAACKWDQRRRRRVQRERLGDQCVRPLDTLPPHFLFRERRRQRRGCSHVRGRFVEREHIRPESTGVLHDGRVLFILWVHIVSTRTISHV